MLQGYGQKQWMKSSIMSTDVLTSEQLKAPGTSMLDGSPNLIFPLAAAARRPAQVAEVLRRSGASRFLELPPARRRLVERPLKGATTRARAAPWAAGYDRIVASGISHAQKVPQGKIGRD